jgi:probable F420-dependent oxidoreductase
MKLGVGLRVRYGAMEEVVRTAEECGYESVWLPEHLIFPADIGKRSPFAGDDHPPVDPTIPTYDNLMVLLTLGLATRRIRLGTWVYNLALRSPFVSARSVQTLDRYSGGRVILGVGAGWIPGEYEAVGVDFASRGRRLDECIEVLRALWTEDQPSFGGEFFTFDPVVFEPKPVQSPVPIHVGGESAAALRRAARCGDGWIGMGHDPASVARQVATLRALAEDAGRDPSALEVSVGATPADAAEVEAFAEAGVDRIIVSPWRRTAEAVDGLRRYAETTLARWVSPDPSRKEAQ